MAINSDKPGRWKDDTNASVDMYNAWFIKFAPEAFRNQRASTAEKVENLFKQTQNLRNISPSDIKANPQVLAALRMSTCPPIARDRLAGLAYVTNSLVKLLESGELPAKHEGLDERLKRISAVINTLLDHDLFPWIYDGSKPTEKVLERSVTIVADRLCGAEADPIIRNEQEKRQLAEIRAYLEPMGYKFQNHPSNLLLGDMPPGTFAFHMIVKGIKAKGDEVVEELGDDAPEILGLGIEKPKQAGNKVKIPIDCVIQPLTAKKGDIPILIEAKSAGDFANVNKRRKEEATKMSQLQRAHPNCKFVLFLCGYFNDTYLKYEADSGIDWIWEHRISDMDKLGL